VQPSTADAWLRRRTSRNGATSQHYASRTPEGPPSAADEVLEVLAISSLFYDPSDRGTIIERINGIQTRR
jgi:hypothetical protein